jgi:hypothetical protein
MRPAMANLFIDDDTTHRGADRVMRAYWLAPRTTRAATVLALQGDFRTGPSTDDGKRLA